MTVAFLSPFALADEPIKPGLKCSGYFTENEIDIPVNLQTINQVRKTKDSTGAEKQEITQYILVMVSAKERSQFAIQDVDTGPEGETIVRGTIMNAEPSVYKLTIPAKEGVKSELLVNKMENHGGITRLEKRFIIKMNCQRTESAVEEVK